FRSSVDLELFEYGADAFEIVTMVKAAYPGAFPESAVIKERSISDLAQTFNEEFGRWLKPGPMLEKLSRLTRLTGEIWQYFDECIQLDGARIFEYDASND